MKSGAWILLNTLGVASMMEAMSSGSVALQQRARQNGRRTIGAKGSTATASGGRGQDLGPGTAHAPSAAARVRMRS